MPWRRWGKRQRQIADVPGAVGLAPPSLRVSGSVRFGGIDLLQAGRETVRGIRGKRIAMIVQQPMTAFDPLYSMGAQLLETLRATTSAFSEKESRGRIVEALEMMHIHNPLDVLKKYPYQLSGGMLQRCMIAVALLQRPDIIIADEPTTGAGLHEPAGGCGTIPLDPGTVREQPDFGFP